jgi:hypothetical protein
MTKDIQEPYTKIPLHVLEAALELEKPRQRQEFIYAAVSYMLTGDYPELTKATKPLFMRFVGEFDRIISGFVTGGRDRYSVERMPGGTYQEKFWNQNSRIIDLHNSIGTQRVPAQYSNATQSVLTQNPNEYLKPNSTDTSGYAAGPSEAPSDAIPIPMSNTKAMAPGVGVALEPPTRGEVENLNRQINDPEKVRAFIEYGNAAGWSIPRYDEGIIFAYFAWNE